MSAYIYGFVVGWGCCTLFLTFCIGKGWISEGGAK